MKHQALLLHSIILVVLKMDDALTYARYTQITAESLVSLVRCVRTSVSTVTRVSSLTRAYEHTLQLDPSRMGAYYYY